VISKAAPAAQLKASRRPCCSSEAVPAVPGALSAHTPHTDYESFTLVPGALGHRELVG